MKIFDAPYSDLVRIAKRLGIRFEGEDISNRRGDRSTGKLSADGATNPYPRRSHSGRRMPHVVCWHGYRDFMREVFKRYPEARIVTGLQGSIDYRGKDDFESTHEDTGTRNVGSMVQPLTYASACDCALSGVITADTGRFLGEFGLTTVTPSRVTIEASGDQLYAWANRSGERWPCSKLARIDGALSVAFNSSGLLDIDVSNLTLEDWEDTDVSADEFNAWSSDVLRDVLSSSHPAYFVTVGQFEEYRDNESSPHVIGSGEMGGSLGMPS